MRTSAGSSRTSYRGAGRADATSVLKSQLNGKKDGALIKALSEDREPCVLVTWDNRMPMAHRAAPKHFGVTLAIVDRKDWYASGMPEEHFYRDVIHRWLHKIEKQESGTARFYARARHRAARGF